MDPCYRDTSRGDFSLPLNSPLRTFGTDGGPVGDPRWTSISTGTIQEIEIPRTYRLFPNYPNPFNPTTAISYQLSAVSGVTLRVFDTLGREVARPVSDVQRAGFYTIHWDASSFPSGVYLCRMEARRASGEEMAFVDLMKMILIK